MQSARCCLVILLRHGLAQENLHAGGHRISNHNRVAREANWPSLSAIVYLKKENGEFHV
jgi:hypothetical protein